jgi:hypothetical protein
VNQINPVHTIPPYLSKIHFNIIHAPTSWSYTRIFLSQLSSANLPYADLLHSTYQISCPFSFAQVVYPKNPSRSEDLRDIS